jgi:hypothetical protein
VAFIGSDPAEVPEEEHFRVEYLPAIPEEILPRTRRAPVNTYPPDPLRFRFTIKDITP